MLQIEAAGGNLPGVPYTVVPPMSSFVEVPTDYTNGYTPGLLVPAFRAPQHDPCAAPASAYDMWWCTEGKNQGVPYGDNTWRGSVNGLSGSIFGTTPDGQRPGIASAFVGLGVCAVLALVLVPLCEKVLGLEQPPKSAKRYRANASFRRGPGDTWVPPQPPFFVVQVLEDKGDYFGRVVARTSGKVVWETMRERSPFVAKRQADKKRARLEAIATEAVAQEVERRARPHRFTSTGTLLTIAPAPAVKKRTRKRSLQPSR